MSKFKVISDIKFMDSTILKIGDEVSFINDKISIETKFGLITLSKSDIIENLKNITELNFKYTNGPKKYRMQLDINCTEDQLNKIEKEIGELIHKII